MSVLAAAEAAAADLVANHPSIPCRLSDMQAFYGFDQPAGPGQEEVQPVWGVEFNLGEAVYLIDGATAAILEVETGS